MHRRRAKVLFVEDEISLLKEFTLVLEREGHRVLSTSQPEEAVALIRQQRQIDILVTDLQLPLDGSASIGLQEAAGGRLAGLVLARIFRQKFKRAPILFWSGNFTGAVRAQTLEIGNTILIPKTAGPQPVLEMIAEALDGFRSGTRPRSFIVHGHDEVTMQAVKRYLQTNLRFPEPVVLRDMPSYGQTIIEKLESYAHSIDLVFVLLTPDDKVVPSVATTDERYRSRQNVIFEMGYFLGVLGRSTGRVILLFRQPIELPSDIGGMVSVDISCGPEAADPGIRQELREWL